MTVERMRVDDIPAVHEIERASFTAPWPAHAFRQELEANRLARYVVAWANDRIVGYAGLWQMVDEAHVTTFAVAPDCRRQGVGEALLTELLGIAESVGASVATLEVRVSNLPARRLYEKYGFRPVGVRPRYYTDNNEDALIMTTPELRSREMRERLRRLAADLEARGVQGPDAASGTGSTSAGHTASAGEGRDRA
ncbi:MAG: ribosomal protein S18-alanine N-acetyltransferase [Candidatus Limnocylindrales bacterium]